MASESSGSGQCHNEQSAGPEHFTGELRPNAEKTPSERLVVSTERSVLLNPHVPDLTDAQLEEFVVEPNKACPSLGQTASVTKKSVPDKRLLEVVGNPHAVESDWMHACDLLGDYKHPLPNKDSAVRRQRNIVLGCLAMLGATSFFAFFAFHDQPQQQDEIASLASSVPPPPPPVAPAASDKDVDFGPYMAHLQRSIKTNWRPPHSSGTLKTSVTFKVMNDGSMQSLKLQHASGDPRYDKAALAAVERTKRFEPLPAGAPNNVAIAFTFDYNLLAHATDF